MLSFKKAILSLVAPLLLVAIFACSSASEKHTVAKAKELIFQERFGESERFFREAREKFPNNLEILYYSGWSFIGNGNADAAYQVFLDCVKRDPKFYGGHQGLGVFHFYKHDLQDAKREFSLALEANPKLAAIYTNLAEVSYAEDDHAETERLLKKAIELSSEKADAYLNLSQYYLRQEKLAPAEEYFAKGRKHPFERLYWEVQSLCLEGAIEFYKIEKNVTSKGELTMRDKWNLRGAKKDLEKCQKKSPRNFTYQNEQDRIGALIVNPPHH